MEKLRALKMAAGANADVVNRREMEITAQITPAKPRRNADSTLVSEDSDVGRPPAGSLTDAIMVTELRREIVDLRADAAASAEEVQRVRRQVRHRLLRRAHRCHFPHAALSAVIALRAPHPLTRWRCVKPRSGA